MLMKSKCEKKNTCFAVSNDACIFSGKKAFNNGIMQSNFELKTPLNTLLK